MSIKEIKQEAKNQIRANPNSLVLRLLGIARWMTIYLTIIFGSSTASQLQNKFTNVKEGTQLTFVFLLILFAWFSALFMSAYTKQGQQPNFLKNYFMFSFSSALATLWRYFANFVITFIGMFAIIYGSMFISNVVKVPLYVLGGLIIVFGNVFIHHILIYAGIFPYTKGLNSYRSQIKSAKFVLKNLKQFLKLQLSFLPLELINFLLIGLLSPWLIKYKSASLIMFRKEFSK